MIEFQLFVRYAVVSFLKSLECVGGRLGVPSQFRKCLFFIHYGKSRLFFGV